MLSFSSLGSREGGIWQDKINLNGRCVFCLEPLKSKSTQRNAHWTSTSLSHLWPYLQLNGPTTQDFYIGINDNDNELIFSQIPQMCALCLQNINILNSLHHDLEVIKAKLREQEKLVNSAAGRIRETVANSVKFRKRNKLQEELVKSKIPTSCISSTTKFLDSLLPDPGSSTVMIINLTPQVTIEESQEDYIIVNSVPDQNNLETNSINNYPEGLTFNAIPAPAEKTTTTTAVSVFDNVLPNPVNAKIELPEETEDITNTDPMHVHVKTELNSDNDIEMDGLSIQTQTELENISNNLTENENCTSTISSQSDKHWTTSDSDHDKGKNCSSGTHLSHTKSYPNQISFLPEDEQLIDVPCSPHSNENTTAKDVDPDPLYDDPLGET